MMALYTITYLLLITSVNKYISSTFDAHLFDTFWATIRLSVDRLPFQLSPWKGESVLSISSPHPTMYTGGQNTSNNALKVELPIILFEYHVINRHFINQSY